MKIDKLLTLGQFVDSLQEVVWSDWAALTRVKKYNQFLKQPLTKEMFVNPLSKPLNYDRFKRNMVLTDDLDSTIWYCDCESYEDAENKVIFNDDTNIRFHYGVCHYEAWINDVYGNRVLSSSRRCNIIHNLAEATSGTLTLKNVTI